MPSGGAAVGGSVPLPSPVAPAARRGSSSVSGAAASAAPACRRTAGRPPAAGSARPAARRPRRRAAAPVASGRTESELPGSEERGAELSLGGLTVPGGADDSGRFPPGRVSPRRGRRSAASGRLGSDAVTDAGEPATEPPAPARRPPGTRPRYLRFAGERARPFADLVARVARRAPATVVDLGCGEGTMTASLAQRWPGARVTGVDSSAEMLAAAARTPSPGGWSSPQGDVRDWAAGRRRSTSWSATPSCTGCPGTSDLLARWAGWLAPGRRGWPCRCRATSGRPRTRCWPSCAGRPRWADRLADAAPRPDAVLEPAGYFDVLTGGRAGRRRLGDDVPARAHRPGPGARLGAQHRAAAGAGPARATTTAAALHRRVRRRAARRPIPRGPTARRCCPSGGSSPSATPVLSSEARAVLTGLHHVQVACPGRQRGRRVTAR